MSVRAPSRVCFELVGDTVYHATAIGNAITIRCMHDCSKLGILSGVYDACCMLHTYEWKLPGLYIATASIVHSGWTATQPGATFYLVRRGRALKIVILHPSAWWSSLHGT